MTGAEITRSSRRDDIQGLRAVGALLVAVYHIWIGRVSGGVDVFFVVSGFLVVGSMARKLEASGKINLFDVVTRLAHRLIPASYFVLLLIAVTGWIWVPKMWWEGVIHQLMASIFYVENWALAFSSVDYLASDNIASPMQHYWAMSAQVQSLVFIAAALGVFGSLYSYLQLKITRVNILVFLGTIFLVSLAYSVLFTARNQVFTYFDTFARIWEFIAGGIVALALPYIRLNNWQRLLGSWLGLAGVLSCGIVLEVSTVFPGYAALWPIISAIMLLVCGEGKPQRFSANRLLSSRPLVWVGDISYSLYLWHWPLLVLYLTLNYQAEADILGGVLVLIGSGVLAYFTTFFVETRFSRVKETSGAILVRTTTLVGLLGVIVFSWDQYRQILLERELDLAKVSDRYLGAATISSTGFEAGTEPIYPGPLSVKLDRGEVYRNRCNQNMWGEELRTCIYGPEDAKNTLAVVGGSNSAQWIPALRKVFEQLPNWKLQIYTKGSCPFSTDPVGRVREYYESCRKWNRALLNKLVLDKPQLVFTMATRTAYPGNGYYEYVPDGYREQWMALLENNIRVVALRDTPRFGFDVPECIEIFGRSGEKCSLQRSDVYSDPNPVLSLPEASALNIIDLSDRFCIGAVCPPVIGNVAVYFDKGHITPAYMRTLERDLANKLIPLLVQ